MKFAKLSNTRPNGRATLLGAAILAVATATCGGAAASDLAVNSYRITFAPADAATPAGAQRLMHRIEVAADWVCGEEHSMDLARRQEIHHCRVQAIDHAVRDAQVPMLTALAQRHGAPLTVAGR